VTQSRYWPGLLAGMILGVFFGIALFLRVYLPYDQVFAGDWIKFTGADAYYHMRLVDNLLHHFPRFITFDPYTFYPAGSSVGWPHFFDWFIAGIAWLVGLGSPTQHTIDVVGVYFPAVLGALTVIPVYFIGRELFNRWAGVISAGLIALIPGEFIGRSILGFADHHVAEALFSTITMLFLILAVKNARKGQMTFNNLRRRDWSTITKPIVYSLLAGIFLAIYLLTWIGGLLFIFLIFAYFVVQFIIDHLRGETTDYLGIVGTLSLFIAAVITLPLLPQTWLSPLYLPSFVIAVVTPVVLAGLSRLMAGVRLKPAYYPLTLLGIGLAGLAIFYFIDPSLLKAMVGRFSVFNPSGAALTILEVHPLLFPEGSFSLSAAWGNFTTGFFLSFISLGIIIYFIIKRGEADKTMLAVWGLIILAATLGQRRFAYYFAVNVALLAGYLSWLILEVAGFKKAAVEPSQAAGKIKAGKGRPKRPQKGGSRPTARYIIMALAVVGVFFLSFFPNISPAIATAKAAHFAPSDAWCESLSWMKENTPEPFGDPDFYYELYEPPQQGEAYDYPESAYSIMAWWDYGHWITRIAHRIPICNPFQQGASKAARFFIAQDEESASQIASELDSKYIVIDYATAVDKFYAMPTWAGGNQEGYYDVYYQEQGSRLVPVLLFKAQYYRSMAARLYNFGGGEVTPQSSTVVGYQEKVSREGVRYKEIISSKSFPSYEEAEAYISSQESDNYQVVSANPFISPVPLAKLEGYRLIYSSNSQVTLTGIGAVSEVKIFEYVK